MNGLVRTRLALVVIAASILGAVPVAVGAAPALAATVCRNGVCDGQKDPGTAAADTRLEPAYQWGRHIELHVSYPDGMGWASIDSGSPGDEVWLDRSFDGGGNHEQKLGDTTIPSGSGQGRPLLGPGQRHRRVQRGSGPLSPR